MAKNDNKRYYWFRLSENFMNSEEVDYLLGQKDGTDYIVIYLKLVMMSINNNGKLTFKVNNIDVPHNDIKLQRDLKFWDIDKVRTAIKALVTFDLLYYDAKNILSISNFKELIGSETKDAKRKREARKQVAEQIGNNVLTISGQSADNVRQEIRDKDNKIVDSISKDILKEDNDFNKSIKGIEEAEYSATKKLFNDEVITADMIGEIDEIFNKSDLSDYAVLIIVNEIMRFSKGKIHNPIAYFKASFPKQEYLWKTLGKDSSNKVEIDPADYYEIIENAKKVWFTNEAGNES